ncbi:hypothetical protein AVU99_gp078 [Mycobacterium phage Lolly9]|uniref:Uncharacterized protein n=1 Tax=Mycobacterium phage Lolly9 TaxID=1698711 RepID=A0A0K2FNE7_9CAUD|nr:hypothetical protein AVU99_gp078 [Mycobacterium phage Lolly9]ALA48519.1 hypothetical protein LOLLY9_103 [Mycobacterium phage Lolly9]QOP65830.1 hypothetical protein PBI_MINILON_108 [Mycobacterium phage MiniLon]
MDPVLVEKERRGAVQELRDRNAWPKAEPVEPEAEVEKPKRGRPAKQDAPEPEPEGIEVAVSE